MQADKIPDEIMREARRCYDKLGTGSIADSEHIARALMARDNRAAEIAKKTFSHGLPGGAAEVIAAAILSYNRGSDAQR